MWWREGMGGRGAGIGLIFGLGAGLGLGYPHFDDIDCALAVGRNRGLAVSDAGLGLLYLFQAEDAESVACLLAEDFPLFLGLCFLRSSLGVDLPDGSNNLLENLE